MQHMFTVVEARETLLLIRPMLDEMMQIGTNIRRRQPELWALVQKSAGNGGNPELSRLLTEFDRLDVLLHRIQDLGVVVKDLTVGLIDFPCMYKGRMIYLCWKYGEDDVHYWHETEAGYSGRQPIDWD